MSSILEKSSVSLMEKRSFFLRSGSIQKIKCSAIYPLRFASTKINKDALKGLIETLIMKGRELLQIALLHIYIATFKLVSTIYSIWNCVSDNSLKAVDICDKTKNAENNLGFHQRLLERIQRLQKQSKGRSVQKKDISQNTYDTTNVKQTNFQTEIAKLRECPSIIGTNEKMNATPLNKCWDYFLIFSVHGCTVFIYLQLLILAIILNTTRLPPGLLFLITSLLLIAIIAFKVFFIEKVKKIEGKCCSKQLITNTVTTTDTRQSRSRPKKVPVIDLENKTLSKVKLL